MRTLIMYTGGTFGMKQTEIGYKPEANYLLDKLLRSDDFFDEEFTAKYRLAQIDMLMFGNYFSSEKISFTQTHQLLLDMFVYGICSLKGHKLINEYKKINEQE